MDPTIATIIAVSTSITSALFGALMLALRQSREDWKTLYQQEHDDKQAAQRDWAENSRKTGDTLLRLSASLDALVDKVDQLPRRREDFEGSRRSHPG